MEVSRPFSLSADSSASNSEQSERVSFSDMHSYLGPAEVVSYPSSFRKHQKDLSRSDVTLGTFNKIPMQHKSMYFRKYE